MSMENEKCTFAFPQNEFGMLAMHSYDNTPLRDEEMLKLVDVVGAAENNVRAECARPVDERMLVTASA